MQTLLIMSSFRKPEKERDDGPNFWWSCRATGGKVCSACSEEAFDADHVEECVLSSFELSTYFALDRERFSFPIIFLFSFFELPLAVNYVPFSL